LVSLLEERICQCPTERLAGPSYKRGPPKGYINAIEQRWQQVESLLGVIISCPDPRTQAIVVELRKDELASGIITRVEAGPFVSYLKKKKRRSGKWDERLGIGTIEPTESRRRDHEGKPVRRYPPGEGCLAHPRHRTHAQTVARLARNSVVHSRSNQSVIVGRELIFFYRHEPIEDPDS
jgi:hypothetical protein